LQFPGFEVLIRTNLCEVFGENLAIILAPACKAHMITYKPIRTAGSATPGAYEAPCNNSGEEILDRHEIIESYRLHKQGYRTNLIVTLVNIFYNLRTKPGYTLHDWLTRRERLFGVCFRNFCNPLSDDWAA